MLRLLLLTTACQAWHHLLSFNEQCSGELSAMKGTKLEATASGGHLPFQFKHALEETLHKRVTAENCAANAADMELFFGMNIGNVIRFLDGSDTKLGQAVYPSGCDLPFGFNWKKLKADFPGVILPTSCRAADFDTSKSCQVKFKILEEFYLELAIKDNCISEADNGFGLPTITVFCSGAVCDSFAKPCQTNSDCTGGVTCDSVRDSNLADALKPLVEMGMYLNVTDDAGCGGNFQQKFWSGMINGAAYLANLTSTLSTAVYSDVKLCGLQSFQNSYVPTDSPTPGASFRCYNGSTFPFSVACNGVQDCSYGEDEQQCGNFSVCGPGMLDSNYNPQGPAQCCPVCPVMGDPYPVYGHYCSSSFCSSNYYYSNNGGGLDFSKVCPDPGNGGALACPGFLLASTTAVPTYTSQTLRSVTPASASQHIIGWTDCDGNVQIGSPTELVVFNGRLPLHNIASQIESVIKSQEPCRTGTAPADAIGWARHFFPWSVPFWGGLFYSTASTRGIFNDVNPAAKLDDDLRYYDSANNRSYPPPNYQQVYDVSPPFANVANAPASCSLTSTTSGTTTCELAADIGSWFGGASFPTGWSGTTGLKFKFGSSCTKSFVPAGLATCEGACDANAKSGCCILRNAFALPPTPGTCPPGYKLEDIDARITNFLFKNASASRSYDTTIQNFVSLVIARAIKFGTGGAPFSDVTGTQSARSICMIDGDGFETNTENWGKTVATESCPVPFTTGTANGLKGCPQLLSGPLGGCTGASCLTDPVPVDCNPRCPVAPTPAFLAPTPKSTTGVNPAAFTAPFFGLVACLGFVALY